MFLFFLNLYHSMLIGEWSNDSWSNWAYNIRSFGNALGKLLTSIFNDGVSYDTFGTDFLQYQNNWTGLIALILATITSIGIVVMAVKGIKRIFSVFFYGVR